MHTYYYFYDELHTFIKAKQLENLHCKDKGKLSFYDIIFEL